MLNINCRVLLLESKQDSEVGGYRALGFEYNNEDLCAMLIDCQFLLYIRLDLCY